MLHALSELNPDDFTDGYSPSDERQKMHQHIEGLELRMQDLEKSLLDMSSREAAGRVTRLIDDLQKQKDEATERLKSLVGVRDASARDIIEGLKSIASICSDHVGKNSQNIRHKLKGLIPTIVQRIEVLLFKRSNRTVIAKAKLLLRNSQERLVTIRKSKGWRRLKHIVYYDKDKRPVYLICPVGSVLWSPLHRREDYNGRPLSDAEISKLFKEWHDVRWAAVDGEIRKISPLYARLLSDYLRDEDEDFTSASLDWC